MEALPAPALLIEASGRILVANTLAESLMRDERVVCMDGRGALEACRPQSNRALGTAIAAGAGPLAQPSLPVPLVSTRSGRCFLAWVLPTRRANRDRSGSASIRDVYQLHTMLVVVTSAEKGRTVPVEAITSAFLLSPAEARLASSLCAGLTPAEYAVATGLSRNTVRKSARRKPSRTSFANGSTAASLTCNNIWLTRRICSATTMRRMPSPNGYFVATTME
jgi:hypothetical protein